MSEIKALNVIAMPLRQIERTSEVLLRTIALTIGLATPSMAENLPFEGVLGDIDGCLYLAGEPHFNVFMVLRPDSIEVLDLVCPIALIDRDEVGEPTSIHAACREGEDNWVESYTIAPMADGEGYVLANYYLPDFPRELRACE